MNPVRTLILAAAGNDAVRRVVATAPVSRDVVRRFVAGETTADAIDAAGRLIGDGLRVTLDHLGEDTTDHDTAERTVRAYLELLDQLHAAGLAADAEVSVKLSAVSSGLAAGQSASPGTQQSGSGMAPVSVLTCRKWATLARMKKRRL